MSSVTREWIAVILFALTFVAFTIAEAVWLQRRQWAAFGKALVFSFATNIISFFIGSTVSFVILGVILAMAWDGSIERVPASESMLWVAMIFALLFPPVLLTVVKRLSLWILKMSRGSAAWFFAFVSSASLFLITIGVPVAFLYLV